MYRGFSWGGAPRRFRGQGSVFAMYRLWWKAHSSLYFEVFYLQVVVVVVVLTLTRIIKSMVTGQAPVTLELRNTPGKTHTQPKVVHAYITADAIHASTRNI